MSSVAKSFLESITEERIYNFMGIKTCLVKCTNDGLWRVTYLMIELSPSDQSFGSESLYLDNLRIIQSRADIGLFGQLITGILDKNVIVLGSENCSTEMIRGTFESDLITRTKAFEQYKIDYPCRRLTSQGVFPKEMDRTVRDLNDILSLSDGHYRDVRDACISILGVEHGTNAFGVQLTVVAPIFVKILEMIPHNGSLTINIECFPERELSNTNIIVIDRINPNANISLEDFVRREKNNTYTQTFKIPGSRLSLGLYNRSSLLEEKSFNTK